MEENKEKMAEETAAVREQADGQTAGNGNSEEAGVPGTEEELSQECPSGKCEKEGEECCDPDGDKKNCHGKEREHERGHCRRELEKARAELEKLRAEADDLKRKWYAVTAENENYRRRTQNDASRRYTEGRNDVVSELFPVGDNLERALASCADDKTKEGLEMVLKSYKKVLEKEGIEELDPTGQPFDAAVAEAIMAVPSADGEEAGVVKQVYVKGYKRGEKVLRYAQVIVTQ